MDCVSYSEDYISKWSLKLVFVLSANWGWMVPGFHYDDFEVGAEC